MKTGGDQPEIAGRTKEITTGAGTTTFTYDHESRAVTLTGPGMAQTNVYNGLDTRVGSTTNSVANTYLRNGAYVTAPVIKDSNATFTPGVSERRGTTTTFSHSGLKNADAQTGVSQAVNATQQYDAFGNLASSTGTWQGQFGYGGGFGYQQDATGLKLLGHRYYDASTGRFLTRDPIKDGRNWYGYVGNDPLGNVDSVGLFVFGITGGGQFSAGVSVSLSSGIYLDTENWHVGFGSSRGRGFAAGAYAGLGAGFTFDPNGRINGDASSHGQGVGLATPVATYDVSQDDGEPADGAAHSLLLGPGAIAAAYWEERWNGMIDLGNPLQNFRAFVDTQVNKIRDWFGSVEMGLRVLKAGL